MPASVSKIYECPRCETPMSKEDKPEKCPMCGFRFAKEGEQLSKKLTWGKSPDRQHFEIIQQDMERFLDKPLDEVCKSLGIKLTPQKEEELKNATVSNEARKKILNDFRSKERDIFLLSTRAEDVEGWIKTIYYLMTISLSSGDKALVSSLATWGQEIGVMARILKRYIDHGGKTNPFEKIKAEKQIYRADSYMEKKDEDSRETKPGSDE